MEPSPLSPLAPAPPLRRPRARRLALADFRSYPSLDLALEGQIVAFVGDNGSGKTNLLEALSLFAPGRGLRRAELADCARIGGSGGWAAALDLDRDDGIAALTRLGAGVEPPAPGEVAQRQFRIDRAPAAGGARAFADHLRVVWLTPQQDGLFLASAGERRRFVDRLTQAVDPDHASRVAAMERALRQRNRLLEQGARDGRWLDAAERELAEISVAVAAARGSTVTRLSALIARDDAAFPSPEIALDGEVESRLAQAPALAVEDWLRAELRAGRARDAAAGRTLTGPHRADLTARHAAKRQPAALCSTGEQKALLVGLTLAHARLVAEVSGAAPLVLLDEIAAHFDPTRRALLFSALEALGGQVFLTGADPAAFADLPGRAQRLIVTPGRVVAA